MNKVIPPLKKGELIKFGYHITLPYERRVYALNLALQHYKPLSVFRKLNALKVLFKNNYPLYSKRLKRDMNYIKETYLKKYVI